MNNVLIQSLFDQILVMSLPVSQERRHHIAEHLPSMGIDEFCFFDAIAEDDLKVVQAQAKGEVATFPPCFRCGKLDCGNSDCNNFLIPAQIACYLSYRRLWQHIAEGESERVLVMEDDVWLHPHTFRVLRWVADKVTAERLPFRRDKICLLRLGWALCEDHADGNAPCKADCTVKMSNPCHALTKNYARALIARDQGIHHTVDVYQHLNCPQSGEAFTVFPPIASELSWTEGRFASTIHPKEVHVAYLRAQGNEAAADSAAKCVAKHIKKKHFRPLLVTGHPRCGTGYTAALCRQLGLDIGHERLWADGISYWMFAVEAKSNPWALDAVANTRRAFAWRYLVMPVRDLANAVGSVIRESQHAPDSYSFRREHILNHLGIDLDSFPTPLERAVRSLIGWYRIVISQKPDLIFRIEDEHERLRDFLISQGLINALMRNLLLDTQPINANKFYKGARYPKPIVVPADWHSLPADTRAETAWYCEQFGYGLPWSDVNPSEPHTGP